MALDTTTTCDALVEIFHIPPRFQHGLKLCPKSYGQEIEQNNIHCLCINEWMKEVVHCIWQRQQALENKDYPKYVNKDDLKNNLISK